MSISIPDRAINAATTRNIARALVPLFAGATAYLLFLSMGEILLRDSDTLWQIRIGQWIVEHRAMPYTDVHTFTRFGEPWMSSSWLSQVLFAAAYESLDWAGPIVLTSLAIGATVTIFIHLLDEYVDQAVGHMEKNAEGRLAITKVTLRPKLKWGGDKQPTAEELDKIHHAAHENCFIANSVKTEVTVEK